MGTGAAIIRQQPLLTLKGSKSDDVLVTIEPLPPPVQGAGVKGGGVGVGWAGLEGEVGGVGVRVSLEGEVGGVGVGASERVSWEGEVGGVGAGVGVGVGGVGG